MNIENLPQNLKNDITLAVDLLKDEGCDSIYLFGSVVTGKFHNNSDIDFGISGLPSSKFFKVYSLLNQRLTTRFDLVDFDEKRELFNLLSDLGEVIEID